MSNQLVVARVGPAIRYLRLVTFPSVDIILMNWEWSVVGSRYDAFASGLPSLEFEPCDRVGIWTPTCAEWIAAQFATPKARKG